MHKVLDEFLCARFPKMYAGRHADMRTTAMCWGFSCGDGWFPILFELSEGIDAELKRLDAEGGFPDGAKYTKEVRTPVQDAFKVTQVKEKYGTLRFYVNGANDVIHKLISEAEHKSAKTCEECGEPGVLRGKHWVKTACEKCAKGELPVGCEIAQKPCDQGTIGCYHDHAAEDAAEEEEIARERAREATESGTTPTSKT